MTLWPGDEVGGRFRVERLVAYQGKADCRDARCTRRGGHMREDGSWDLGECFGWHCSLCDAPCSSQGHNCPRSSEADALGGDAA